MEVLIVEDEKLSREHLANLIHQYDSTINIVAALDSVEDAVKYLKEHQHPDLLFLDIHLADGLSFEIFAQVSVHKPIVFTTAYDQFALKAFEVNSVDYLIKPINYQQLSQAIHKYQDLQVSFQDSIPADLARILRQGQKNYKERFLVKLGRRLSYKTIADIGYIYADGKIVYLVEKTTNRKFIVDHTLDELASHLLDPARFFRINRTFIIPIDSVKEVQPYPNQRLLVCLQQTKDQDFIVSRDKSTPFKAWLNY